MIDQIEAKYTLFDSVEDMLSRETLSDVLKQQVNYVKRELIDVENSNSGNELYFVTVDDDRFAMKYLDLSQDWISVVSEDHLCRSVTTWQYGILDKISPYIKHEIIAGCHDGDNFALLMKDLSDDLLTSPILPTQMHLLLDAQAAMHATFWEENYLTTPALGLAKIDKLMTLCWYDSCFQYRHDIPVVDLSIKGWDILLTLVDKDVREALESIAVDTQPVLDSLAKYPRTLIHADYRLANLALQKDTGQVIAFDWQMASYAPATVGLCWFIMSADIMEFQDSAAEYYRQQLLSRLGDRFDQSLWQPMYDLGCLVEILRKGNLYAFLSTSHPEEGRKALMKKAVQKYNHFVRKSLQWL